MMRFLRYITLAAIICILIFIFHDALGQSSKLSGLSMNHQKWFAETLIQKKVYRLFDLGVADVNSDDALDIYTSNHNHGQILLLGREDNGFDSNIISEIGLDQDPEFSGLEYSGRVPLESDAGIYIYWHERELLIKINKLKDFESIGGVINVSTSAMIKEDSNVISKVKKRELSSGITSTTLEFSAQRSDGKIILSPDNVSLPINITIDDEYPLDRIFIGNNKKNPQAHRFRLLLRDRHGLAWTDYDGKGMMDVLIVRGGLKGKIDKIPEHLNDELLINSDNIRYENHIEETGLRKEGCPALQTAWVDYDQDNMLDIYTVCYQAADETKPHPNQLYHQISKNNFINVAQGANLDINEMGSFLWLDIDNDKDVDLFWVSDDKLSLYVNDSGAFELQSIGANPGSVASRFEDSNKVTTADYDLDGDLDIFVASPKQNTLLINDKGVYTIIEPNKIGLPTQSLTANWVDYDNDGLVDLHVLPSGLYRQSQDHNFTKTHMLEFKSSNLIEARCTWFDSDNNGSNDLLVGTRFRDSFLKKIEKRVLQTSTKASLWNIALYKNIHAQNNWLQINLRGPYGNRNAIGAHVEVQTLNGTQRQIVGQFDGSHYSQGHYRLYFGLGNETNINSAKVFWPDGRLQELNNITANQRLTISWKE